MKHRKTAGKARRDQHSGIPIRRVLYTAVVAAWVSGGAMANPTGPEVVHGSADFDRSGPGTLNVTNTPGTIIQWQDFSIAPGELTRFIQQDSASAVLNRVVGQDPSEILGSLVSNGRVFLINPNGVLFGDGAQVDTAGLIASTLNLSDADFIAGHYRFEGDTNSGAIVNRGYLRAGKNGEIVLIAPNIENHGVIQTEGGNILLAAGERLLLTSLDLRDVTFEVQAPANSVLNLGKLLTSKGAIGVFGGTLRQHGVIRANRVTRDADGTVWLVAGDSNVVSGTIDVSGQGTHGGEVRVLGREVKLQGATIDASGDNGGGTVLVGGDYQGGGAVPTATNTSMDAASSISVDAVDNGNGGKLILWSDDTTTVYGQLSARGGANGGDGGLIETSGKKRLEFTVAADASAPRGRPGLWLLDPEDITIDGGKASAIETSLNKGTSVSVTTSDTGTGKGDITVASSITKSAGGDTDLSLNAHGRIDVNAGISSTAGKLDVSLNAGSAINVNSSISTNGGKVSTKITGVTSPEVGDPVPAPPEATTTPVTDLPVPAPDGTTAPEVTQVTKEVVDESVNSVAKVATPPAHGTPGEVATTTIKEPVIDSSATPVNITPVSTPETTTGGSTGGSSTQVTVTEVSNPVTTVNETGSGTGGTSAPTSGTGSSPTTASTTTGTSTGGADPVIVARETSGKDGGEININGSITTAGGDVHVDSGSSGTTRVSGKVDSSSDKEGESGGDILLLGDRVGLFDEAEVDASGDTGGGTILIGGDRQGKNPSVRNASAIYIGKDTKIKSDATGNGDGGKIILFAEDSAKIYGRISARGGTEGGDGGFVETSGLKSLDVRGNPDLYAALGKGGVWLIDPDFDVNITSGATSGVDTGSDPWAPTASGTNIDVADIYAALCNNGGGGACTGGATVQITTASGSGTEEGDINWLADLDIDGLGLDPDNLSTLELLAGRNINMRANIEDSERLVFDPAFMLDYDGINLLLRADQSGSGTGRVVVGATDRDVTVNTRIGSIDVEGAGLDVIAVNNYDTLLSSGEFGDGGMRINVTGGVRVISDHPGTSGGDARLESRGSRVDVDGSITGTVGAMYGQSIDAQYIEVIADDGSARIYNTNSAGQYLRTTGANTDGVGILVQTSSSSDDVLYRASSASIESYGGGEGPDLLQRITVSNANYLRVQALGIESEAEIRGGDQEILLQGGGMNRLEVGSAGAGDYSESKIVSTLSQDVTAGSVLVRSSDTGEDTYAYIFSDNYDSGDLQQSITTNAGDIEVVAGSGSGGQASIEASDNSQLLNSARDILVTGGGEYTDAYIDAGSLEDGVTTQSLVAARNIEITGGAGGVSGGNASIDANWYAFTDPIGPVPSTQTITAGGDIVLSSHATGTGDASVTSNRNIDISASGDLALTGGENSDAKITGGSGIGADVTIEVGGNVSLQVVGGGSTGIAAIDPDTINITTGGSGSIFLGAGSQLVTTGGTGTVNLNTNNCFPSAACALSTSGGNIYAGTLNITAVTPPAPPPAPGAGNGGGVPGGGAPGGGGSPGTSPVPTLTDNDVISELLALLGQVQQPDPDLQPGQIKPPLLICSAADKTDEEEKEEAAGNSGQGENQNAAQ